MEPSWHRAREPRARLAWERVLSPLAAELSQQADEVSRRIVVHLQEQIPELFPDPESLEEARASVKENVEAIWDMIEAGTEPRSAEPPPATLAYARSLVRRRVPEVTVMRTYRLGHEAAWDLISAQIAARCTDTEEFACASALGSAWLFSYIDIAQTQAERMFEEERERWLRTASAWQAETIEEIIAGRLRDTTRASGRLRYELRRHHLAAIVWIDRAPTDHDPTGLLEAAIAQLAAGSGSGRPLLHPLGGLVLGAWFGFDEPPAAAVVEALGLDPSSVPGVRAAVGAPGFGVSGFRETLFEAREARRVATLAARHPGTVTRYDQIALLALATADVSQARRFVSRQLGALSGDEEESLRLAATLRVFLEENGSRSRAAKRLGIHDNTVTYRVRQAEQILGRPLDGGSLELRLALALAAIVRRRAND